MPLRPILVTFSDLVVVHPQEDRVVDSLWCRRFLAECDGKQDAAEIARKLKLPPEMTAKIVQKIITQGWGRVEIEPQYSLLVQAMIKRLGEERSREIFGSAAGMLRRSPEVPVTRLLADGIIAVELLLTDEEHQKLSSVLNKIRQARVVRSDPEKSSA